MSMEMKVSFDENENKWLFIPVGEINIYTSSKFQEEMLNKYKTKKTDLLIDGKELDYIDSTGLGALIYILRVLKDEDYKIHLKNMKPNILKLFTITELDKLFVIRGEKDE